MTKKNLIWPDYENCLTNLPNSILNYFGQPTEGNTLPLADKYLQKEYKNVVLLLLDGMGQRNGCTSDVVKEELKLLEEAVAQLTAELEDTLVFVTADHGHIDTDYVMWKDYPALADCLVRLPSLEPRVLNFFVKEGKHAFFEAEFNKEFGDKFLLMPMEEAIEKQLFGTGTPHKQFRSMLGDYLAIAISDLSIYYIEERWVSMHGSVTEDEMLIPLIVLEKPKEDLT